jgi:hypothetical protein
MKKQILLIAGMVFLLSVLVSPVFGATPFSAPAAFALKGSSITCVVTVKTRNEEIVQAAIDPNPAPVTGNIGIDQLNQASGAFSGTLDDISTSTSASLDQLGLNFDVTITIDSDDMTGIFIWSRDLVVFDPQNFVVTLTFGSKSWPIVVSGVPWSANYRDGQLTLQKELVFEETYGGYDFTTNIGINLVGLLQSITRTAEPWISLYSDHTAYAGGDRLQFSITAGNPGETQTVDFYLALADPSGALYFWPTYTTAVTPALTGLPLANGFSYPLSVLVDLLLPSALPSITDSGQYAFYAAFCEPGTLNFVGGLASAPFAYTVAAPSGFDGVWTGNAQNTSGDPSCGTLANVTFNISGNRITGEADMDLGGGVYDGYTVTGTVGSDGSISDGILWEEFGIEEVAVGSFGGVFSGTTVTGTWGDRYGCSGTYTLTRTP